MKKLYLLSLLNLFSPVRPWVQATDSLRYKLDYLFAHVG